MSLRLRIALLVVFVAVSSTAATAWLTLRQASAQLTETVVAGQRDVELVVAQLSEYGQVHGTWSGIEGQVRQLAERLRQRIRVTTESGQVLADSDLLNGRPARPPAGVAVIVDPRPAQLPAVDGHPLARFKIARSTVDEYGQGWSFAACVTALGVDVRKTTGVSGIPVFEAAGANGRAVDDCRRQAESLNFQDGAVARQGLECSRKNDPQDCLQRLFMQDVSRLAPQPLRLQVGALDETPYRLSSRSIAVAACVVGLVTVASALLLGRRVMRPVGALTAASRRLGSGDLTERVPVTGRDELAEMAREFNRMARSLEQSEQRQRRLIADIAHELRTPLANLRGYLEALSDGVLPSSRELFTSLHEEALLQQRIVDDLQDLALAEAGALAYHPVRVEVAELLLSSQAAHAAAADAAGIRLNVEAVPVQIFADPDRLRQVVGNLIRNALVATPAGGTITVRAWRSDSSGAVIEVVDTGRGIAADDLPHVFERFWRADPARGRDTGGSGLGLAIASRIITDHGGTIVVTSQVGAGTRFEITLPEGTDDCEP